MLFLMYFVCLVCTLIDDIPGTGIGYLFFVELVSRIEHGLRNQEFRILVLSPPQGALVDSDCSL